ncbi:MAG: ABC transporter permease subunit [Lachnospiraceae bacterium]
MYNFWNIVGFEYKKLFKKKMVWMTLIIMFAISLFMPLSSILSSKTSDGSSYYENTKEHIQEDIQMSGQQLDENMFSKYRNTDVRMPNTFSRMLMIIIGNDDITNMNAEQMYEGRTKILQADRKNVFLTEQENKYWVQQDKNIAKPFLYQYCSGYQVMIAMFYTLEALQVLLCAICVSSIFAEEHMQHTDQLNLCTAQGKSKLFFAKIFVGVTFSLAATVGLMLASAIPNFMIYGLEGFYAQIQMIYPGCSYALSTGNVMCILAGIVLITAVLHSSIAMVLSEHFQTNVISLAIMTGYLMLALAFNIPEQYRVASQIWNGMPNNLVSMQGLLDARLVTIGKEFFMQWQVVPVVYLVVVAVAVWLCYQSYRKYNI